VKQFQTHGILYKTSILTKEEFQMVKDDISSLSLCLVQETSSSVAHGRIGAALPPDCKTVEIFSDPNGSMIKLVNELVQRKQQQQQQQQQQQEGGGEGGGMEDDNGSVLCQSPLDNRISMKLASNKLVPVEVRVYQQRGAGMEAHYDVVLFAPEQMEVVFTLENTSDCVTRWWEEVSRDSGGVSNGGGSLDDIAGTTGGGCWKQVETEANSAILLRAGPRGARHAVSPLKNKGKRVILKLVYVEENAVFLNHGTSGGAGGGGGLRQQFGSMGRAGNNSKRKMKKQQNKKKNTRRKHGKS
jgi:hypothetical protein